MAFLDTPAWSSHACRVGRTESRSNASSIRAILYSSIALKANYLIYAMRSMI